jgi:hypothetical protein
VRPTQFTLRAVRRVGPGRQTDACHAEGDDLHAARIEKKAAEVAQMLGTVDEVESARRFRRNRAKRRAVRCRCGCNFRWDMIRDAADALGKSTPTLVKCIREGRPIHGHVLEYAD